MKNNQTTERLLDASREIWAGYLTHPFVRGIADGSLAVNKFRFYLLQDYLYLFDYCASLIINQVMGDGPGGSGDEPASGGNESGGQAARWETVTDFFELLEMAAEAKIKVLEKTPYLADFMVRGYYSEDGIVKEDLNRATMEAVSSAFRKYFRNVDYSKFKPDVPPMEIYEMLVWMTEGYLHDRRKSNASISMKEIMEKFYVWEKWLKQIAYKEEYQKTEA